ncbi:MAG: Fe-Mn family superoxide dismutase [Clostridiales bacterium]|jgi:Fe-Mn family superoxide dismutase|nr:Fe-Mn family superoxide dismutase [Clostridiales bacterium]
MAIKPIEFPYDTSAVTERLFKEHMSLYRGYCEKFNEITARLGEDPKLRPEANKTYSRYRGLKRGESFSMGGALLHELYFQNMVNSPEQPGALFNTLTKKYYGGFGNWAVDFAACAKSARGWCVTVMEQRSGTVRNILMDSHDEGLIIGAYPILVADVYEHAYFMDYGANAAAYLGRFIESVKWSAVDARLSRIKT